MRPLIFILTLQLFAVAGFGQTDKEEAFTKTVKQIIIAFSRQDSAGVAKYIHKKIGVYQLDRKGVFDDYNHFKAISFSDESYPQVLFTSSKNIQQLSLQYAKLPYWDCDREIWTKKGLFVDTTKIDHSLSQICKERNKGIPDHIPNKTINYFYELEKKSRRIVLFDYHKKGLVFYLSYTNGIWFLTIVDYASSDCSV